MRQITSKNLVHILRATLLAAVPCGCSLDEEVSLGRAGDRLNLDLCQGTPCEAAFDAVDAGPGATIECTAGSPLVAVAVPLSDLGACDPYCTWGWYDLALAPDGSYWILTTISRFDDNEPTERVHLRHVTADGEVLGAKQLEIDGDTVEHLDLVVDQHGVATVAAYSQYSPNADAHVDETTTLYSFLPGARLRGTPLGLYGVASPYLVADVSGDYLIAGNAYGLANRGVLGRVQRHGEIEIANNQVPTRGSTGRGIVAFAGNEEQGYTVLAEEPDSKDEAPTYRLLRYGTDFDPRWSASLPSPAGPGLGANMVRDDAGRTVVAVALDDESTGVYGYDEDGAHQFSVVFDGLQGQVVPELFEGPDTSLVWLGLREADRTTHVVSIDAAAATCVTHEYSFPSSEAQSEPEVDATAELAFTPVVFFQPDRLVRLAEVAP